MPVPGFVQRTGGILVDFATASQILNGIEEPTRSFMLTPDRTLQHA